MVNSRRNTSTNANLLSVQTFSFRRTSKQRIQATTSRCFTNTLNLFRHGKNSQVIKLFCAKPETVFCDKQQEAKEKLSARHELNDVKISRRWRRDSASKFKWSFPPNDIRWKLWFFLFSNFPTERTWHMRAEAGLARRKLISPHVCW